MDSSDDVAGRRQEDRRERSRRGADNQEWGREAERVVGDYFLKQGYTIRERNWKCGKVEIDLILEKDRTIVFVEVKARKEETQDPVLAVGKEKRGRIIRGADVYLRSLPLLYQYRFDIVALTGNREDYSMKHYPDAYMPGVNGIK